MKLRIMNPEELKRAYETDLVEAFPPAELKPLSAMERMRAAGIYDPLGLFDEAGEPVGYILLWKHPDGQYILIDYLCVPAKRRNGGIGGKLLGLARDFYPPDTDCALFGVHFRTICWAAQLPAEDEILRRHQEIYLRQFGPERYRRYIQIPLAPGEAPYPLSDWPEGPADPPAVP